MAHNAAEHLSPEIRFKPWAKLSLIKRKVKRNAPRSIFLNFSIKVSVLLIDLKTKKEPEMKFCDFGAFQIKIHVPSHEKLLLYILFGGFHSTSCMPSSDRQAVSNAFKRVKHHGNTMQVLIHQLNEIKTNSCSNIKANKHTIVLN